MLDKRVRDSLLRLAKKIGPEILSVPINIERNSQHVAYTTSRGIWLSDRIVNTEPHNAEVYIAHEIFHHVVGDCEQTSRYHPAAVNMAEDYRINQLLEELLGYDVTKIGVIGLRDKKYDKLSIKQIAESLVKQGVTSYPHYAQRLPSKEILAAANAVKLRYRLFDHHWYFHMDQMDMSVYLNNMEASVYKACEVFTLRNVNLQYAVTGLWAHLYLPQATHTMKTPRSFRALRPSQAITYCIDADSFRSKTNGDALRSAIVASKILGALDDDALWLAGRIRRAKDYIKRIESELKTRRNSRHPVRFLKLTTRELRKRLNNAQARLTKYTSMKPLHAMLEKQKVKIRPGRRVKMPSLHSAEQERNRGQVVLPNIIASDLTRRIFSASRRIHQHIGLYVDASEKIKSDLGDLLRGKGNGIVSTDKNQTTVLDEVDEVDEVDEDTFDAASCDNEEIDDKPSDKEGKGRGRTTGKVFESKMEIEQAIFDHSSSLLQIIMMMKEIEAQLSSKPRRRTDDNPSMPVGLGYGSDLENVEASEFALLANEATRTDFYVRLSQGSLMQRQPIERRQSAVIFCIDTSGSMHGDRLEQAIAFALAFARKLIQYGRGFSVVLFDAEAYASITFDGRPSIADILLIFKHLRSGGTEFQPPIERALDIRDEQKWKETVIILATDGESSFTDPEAIKRRLGRKDKLQAVLIGKSKFNSEETEELFDDIYNTSRKDSMLTLVNLAKNHI